MSKDGKIHVLVFSVTHEGSLGTMDAMQEYYAVEAPAVGDEIEIKLENGNTHTFKIEKRRWHSFRSGGRGGYNECNTSCRVFVNHA